LLILFALSGRAQTTAAAHQNELAGNFAAAEKAYEDELKTHPSAELWQRLGLTRYLQNKFETAVPAFREAVRVAPALWTSRLFLGICFYRLNRFEAARTELVEAERRARPAEPGRDDVEYWLGATLIALNQRVAGLVWIERLLGRSPHHLEALQLAAQAYADLGSKLWNQVAERSYDTAAGREVHGHALEAEGKLEGALEAYRQSRALDPKRSGPGIAIGRLLLRQGKAADARTALAQELKRNPLDPEACYYAGLAAIQLGHAAEAAPLLETAVRWAQLDPEPAIALAQVYLALGDRERAATAVRKALEVAPQSTAARELLAAVDPARSK